MNTEGKPLSKEEIIDNWIYNKPFIPLKEAVGGAMDEYAEIDSIGFAEWIDKNDYKTGAQNKHWYKWIGMECEEIPYTTAQLYQLYKKQQP